MIDARRTYSLLKHYLLCVCMFVYGFSPHSRIFHSYGSEGMQILTYARHSWPWAVRVLCRATPTVIRVSVYNGHLRGPVTLTPIVGRSAVELSLPVFTT